MPRLLQEIEYRTQHNKQTRDDTLYLLETIRELRIALVKAAIPLNVLNMVYHDRDEFAPTTMEAIQEGIDYIDAAIVDTVGISAIRYDDAGRKYYVPHSEKAGKEEVK